jgi:hypothetical protein
MSQSRPSPGAATPDRLFTFADRVLRERAYIAGVLGAVVEVAVRGRVDAGVLVPLSLGVILRPLVSPYEPRIARWRALRQDRHATLVHHLGHGERDV